MTQSIPTYCEQCGHVWAGNEIALGEGANIIMRGNKTQCPACGALTPMLDGTFTVKNGTLALEDGPQITQDKLGKILSVLQNLSSDASIEEIEQEVDNVADEKGFFRSVKKWIENHGASVLRTSTDILRFFEMLWRLF